MQAGGNSGVFVWSGIPKPGKEFPIGVEVQMLELEWVNLNPDKDGKPRPLAYVHGELFGVQGATLVPDNPRGPRSKSVENRCLGKGQWNVYDVVCVDGTIKLSVNGKFVNGISKCSQRKGYLSLEAEGGVSLPQHSNSGTAAGQYRRWAGDAAGGKVRRTERKLVGPASRAGLLLASSALPQKSGSARRTYYYHFPKDAKRSAALRRCG